MMELKNTRFYKPKNCHILNIIPGDPTGSPDDNN